jgi:hypothetical protein
MIKILNIVSSHNPQNPIAVIRTDENKLEFIQDLYGISDEIGDSYQALLDYLNQHNHLSISPSTAPLTFRQMNLKTGETIAISEDGKTILLNGKLLLANAKANLQNMLESGDLQVVGEAAPYIYKPKKTNKPSDASKVMQDHLKSLRPPEKTGSALYDAEIEKSGMSWIGQQLLCVAKHGTFIGGEK